MTLAIALVCLGLMELREWTGEEGFYSVVEFLYMNLCECSLGGFLSGYNSGYNELWECSLVGIKTRRDKTALFSFVTEWPRHIDYT